LLKKFLSAVKMKNKKLKKIKIGITGASGVLGSSLIKKFKQNYKISVFQSDITNYLKVKNWIKKKNFDAIFHLACLVPVKLCNENPLEACSINIGGTNNILESIIKLKKKPWLFFASTSHVYKLKKTPLSENDKILPKTFYGYTKWISEKLIENADLNYKLTYCIGRIFSFYSNLQSKEFLYPSIKEKIFLHNAYNTIDIQKVENIANIVYKLFKKRAHGIINIGTGKGTQISNFAKKLTKKNFFIITNSKNKNSIIADIKRLNSFIKL
jgi:nucleoside-diphosphate-sugar epimerase